MILHCMARVINFIWWGIVHSPILRGYTHICIVEIGPGLLCVYFNEKHHSEKDIFKTAAII